MSTRDLSTGPTAEDLYQYDAQERLVSLTAENARLHAQLDLAREHYRELRSKSKARQEQHNALLSQYLNLQARVTVVQEKARQWQEQCSRLESLLHNPQSPQSSPEVSLDSLLRRLLALAHPDKWSQGQPATALAHEIAVYANALRDRREVQP